MPKDRKDASVRLTPAFFHILLTVAARPTHGYAIMQAVQERTRGTVKLGPGSLYWAIKRLVESELLDEVDAPAREDDDRRRYYALTPFGRTLLKREVEILADIVGYAESQKLIERVKASS